MGNRGERETREGVRVTGTTMNFMHVPNCKTENRFKFISYSSRFCEKNGTIQYLYLGYSLGDDE